MSIARRQSVSLKVASYSARKARKSSKSGDVVFTKGVNPKDRLGGTLWRNDEVVGGSD